MGHSLLLYRHPKTNRGFYFSTALGVIYSSAKQKVPSQYGKARYQQVLVGAEFGMGARFRLSDKNDGLLGLSFSGTNEQKGLLGRDPLLLIGLRAAFGF